MRKFIDRFRDSKKTPVLLVSATPFSVEFKEEQGDIKIEDAQDLKGLLEMVWGKDAFQPHYQELLDKQRAYIQAVRGAVARNDEQDIVARRARREYQEHLRQYCARTERPRQDEKKEAGIHKSREGEWKTLTADGSLRRFLDRFDRGKTVRSPVTSMFMDGHTFTSFGYEGLKDHKGPRLPGIHWKTERLRERLERDFHFDDGLHSFALPPLWLAPDAELRNRKHLIFTEYRFIPEEVSEELARGRRTFGRVKGKRSGSVLGYFPSRKQRATSKEAVSEVIHFPLFYPFLIFELDATIRARRLLFRRSRIEGILEADLNAIDMVLAIEEALAVTELENARLKQRRIQLTCGHNTPATDRFREYLRFLLFEDGATCSIGAALARMSADLVCKLEFDEEDRANVFKKYETSLMGLAAAALRLFATPEAQELKLRARSFPRIPRHERWNSYLAFALWYAKRFKLEATLIEFAGLLSRNGMQPDVVLGEIQAAVSLRKGAIGTRYIRSFHDRKIDDADESIDAEEVSVKSLRAAFNSPFAPYVLVSTSVGQEGLDFHRYCTSVIHWSPPSSPSVLRQREGRVDRFCSLQIRRARAGLSQSEQAKISESSEMSPDFVVMLDGKRLNRVDREVWYLPFTSQEAAWRRCLDRMYYNDLLIGAPDPLADERLLLGAVGDTLKERNLRLMRTYAVSLAPEPISEAKLKDLKKAA